MQRIVRRAHGVEDATLQLVQDHAAELLRFARRFSHCADDAHDAYQRTLEILVRRLRSEPPRDTLPWVRTVLRHEALAVRRERERHVTRGEVELERFEDRDVGDPADRVVAHERLSQVAEALQRLKPQEVTALVLRAEGLTYHEICDRTGWTYTKTNRSVTEGRRALLDRLGAIESGAECSRWLPLLSKLADGEATAAELVELRPHLRTCSACRATLRELHAAPGQVAALVPVALLPLTAASGGGLLDHVGVALHGLAERATLLAARVQGGLEAVPAAKVAAVAASTAALAGGGAAIQQVAEQQRPPQRATAIDALAPTTRPRSLLSIVTPIRPAPAASTTRRARRPAPAREFGSQPSEPSEFTPRAAPTAEFAATPPRASSPVSPATVAAAPPAAPPAFTPPSAPPASEFGRP